MNCKIMRRGMNIVITLLALSLVRCTGGTDQHANEDFQKKIDVVRVNNELPGLTVVIFSSDSVYGAYYSGYKKIGSEDFLSTANRFHLGSNTKAFIGFAAASMVEEGLIKWDSKYFDICPENKNLVRPEYHDVTLNQILRHRGGLISKTEEFIKQ